MPIFSPLVFHYLATGDVDGAIAKLTIDDCTPRIRAFVNIVSANNG